MSTSQSVDIGTLIHFPEARKGRPCLAGTGMSVYRVVNLHRMGMNPEEMHRGIPDIPLSHFYAALAHYYANQGRIDREMAKLERQSEPPAASVAMPKDRTKQAS